MSSPMLVSGSFTMVEGDGGFGPGGVEGGVCSLSGLSEIDGEHMNSVIWVENMGL